MSADHLVAGAVTIQFREEEWMTEQRAAEHGKVNLGGPGCGGGGLVLGWRNVVWAGRWSGGRKVQRTRRVGGWSQDW